MYLLLHVEFYIYTYSFFYKSSYLYITCKLFLMIEKSSVYKICTWYVQDMYSTNT
jgi:hypothetical protein